MARLMDIQPIEDHKFQFTRNWFRNRNMQTFREYVHLQWTGRPMVYLELGVFEGMSLVWMLQYVLDHPDSRAVGVDPWLMTRKLDENTMTEVMVRAYRNLHPWKSHPVGSDLWKGWFV